MSVSPVALGATFSPTPFTIVSSLLSRVGELWAAFLAKGMAFLEPALPLLNRVFFLSWRSTALIAIAAAALFLYENFDRTANLKTLREEKEELQGQLAKARQDIVTKQGELDAEKRKHSQTLSDLSKEKQQLKDATAREAKLKEKIILNALGATQAPQPAATPEPAPKAEPPRPLTTTTTTELPGESGVELLRQMVEKLDSAAHFIKKWTLLPSLLGPLEQLKAAAKTFSIEPMKAAIGVIEKLIKEKPETITVYPALRDAKEAALTKSNKGELSRAIAAMEKEIHALGSVRAEAEGFYRALVEAKAAVEATYNSTVTIENKELRAKVEKCKELLRTYKAHMKKLTAEKSNVLALLGQFSDVAKIIRVSETEGLMSRSVTDSRVVGGDVNVVTKENPTLDGIEAALRELVKKALDSEMESLRDQIELLEYRLATQSQVPPPPKHKQPAAMDASQMVLAELDRAATGGQGSSA